MIGLKRQKRTTEKLYEKQKNDLILKFLFLINNFYTKDFDYFKRCMMIQISVININSRQMY